jgi:hypothetical protein
MYYGKHPVELKIDIHVRRICITIKYCCIVIVIQTLFNPQFYFRMAKLYTFNSHYEYACGHGTVPRLAFPSRTT